MNDMNKWRTKIIKIAHHTKKHMEYLDAKEKKTLQNMKMKDIANMKESISNKLMLDAMELE